MARGRRGKGRRDEGASKTARSERRTGAERRSGHDRRADAATGDGGRRGARHLYKTDLDRYLWSWASPSRKKRRKERERRAKRRKVAGIVASAAGAVGAAGLSLFLFRRLREETDERPGDPEHAQADLDEADFEG